MKVLLSGLRLYVQGVSTSNGGQGQPEIYLPGLVVVVSVCVGIPDAVSGGGCSRRHGKDWNTSRPLPMSIWGATHSRMNAR
mmetsp:Transcript_39063/g.110657  ORF Transcript_39063/g.110657 Transcript_39063/m.110657 type:complete len:81 (-) Transcript_39063:745-987(-)|eukprot:CAMPEP_0117685154 /NCGR_PEP_ID=MMETSP0804-20121206/21565_1 /TAXON_ID=1074897 /ORGANISM="Tetraselmis astigmatica, Strain CCMP880" /LENGTH=80 /DNA_ID=CAMNT_0005496361 /DNA_START=593 /DNA_END=835 /DNA_ORIENTATION=-